MNLVFTIFSQSRYVWSSFHVEIVNVFERHAYSFEDKVQCESNMHES